jgi:SlyX protein
MESRLTEIEIKLTLTEDLVESLNLVIHRQQEQIDTLQRQIRHLYEMIQNTPRGPEVRDLRDEIPPHY